MTLASLVAAPHEALFAPPSHLFTSVCGQTDAEMASVVASLALTIADTASPHVSRAIRNMGLLYPRFTGGSASSTAVRWSRSS